MNSIDSPFLNFHLTCPIPGEMNYTFVCKNSTFEGKFDAQDDPIRRCKNFISELLNGANYAQFSHVYHEHRSIWDVRIRSKEECEFTLARMTLDNKVVHWQNDVVSLQTLLVLLSKELSKNDNTPRMESIRLRDVCERWLKTNERENLMDQLLVLTCLELEGVFHKMSLLARSNETPIEYPTIRFFIFKEVMLDDPNAESERKKEAAENWPICEIYKNLSMQEKRDFLNACLDEFVVEQGSSTCDSVHVQIDGSIDIE